MFVTIDVRDRYGSQIQAEYSVDDLNLIQIVINLGIPVYAYCIPDSVRPYPVVLAIVEKLIADKWLTAPNGFKL